MKLKLNWGWSIFIAIGMFMSFILYFVIKVQTNSSYDNELVIEDYYKQEIGFQQEINKQQNAQNLQEKVQINTTPKGIEVVFPKVFEATKIKGKMSLYRPSNLKLDFEKSFSLSTSNLLIPTSELVSGRWDITLDWTYEGKSYLNKQTIYL